jgi:hypothetical protein
MSSCSRTIPLLLVWALGLPTAWGVDAAYDDLKLTSFDEIAAPYDLVPAFPPSLPAEQQLTPVAVGIDFTERGLPPSHWHLDAELLLYDLDYGTVNFNQSLTDDEKQRGAGMRFTFGWEGDQGYGIRTSLSGAGADGITDSFDPRFSVPGDSSSDLLGFSFGGSSRHDPGSVRTEVIAGGLNLDFYKRFRGQRWDVASGAGLTTAVMLLNVPRLDFENTVSAGGISLFSEGKYVFFKSETSEFALVGGGRVAMLGGEWESKLGAGVLQTDTDLTVTEGTLGFQWKRVFSRSILTLRTQYEHQLWDSDVTDDLVMQGFAIQTGVHW